MSHPISASLPCLSCDLCLEHPHSRVPASQPKMYQATRFNTQVQTPVGFWSCVLLSACLLFFSPSPKVVLLPPPPSMIALPCGLLGQASHAGLGLLHVYGSGSSGPCFSQRPCQITVGPYGKSPGGPPASSSGGTHLVSWRLLCPSVGLSTVGHYPEFFDSVIVLCHTMIPAFSQCCLCLGLSISCFSEKLPGFF